MEFCIGHWKLPVLDPRLFCEYFLVYLKKLAIIFRCRVYPFGAPSIRAVKKEAKHYHFDWTVIGNPGIRFENLIAVHLLDWVYFQQDREGRDIELRYFRDIDKREVDFVVTERTRPLLFVECKTADGETAPGLKYLKQRFPLTESVQVSLKGGLDVRTREGIRRCPAHVFLSELTVDAPFLHPAGGYR